jgi:isoleucyl-tRNA synthetase
LVDARAPESVHLAKWPQADRSLVDETLNREMALVMRLVSLGHAARQKANRKVRQPLAEAAFALGRLDERHAVETYADLITDELNVKKVRLLDASSEAATFVLKPLPKQLGQKYGNKFPAIQKAILGMDAAASAPRLLSGAPLAVTVDGDVYDILPDEVEVRADARAGFAVAADGAYLAALVTELTPELVQEGQAREFVRRVQDLRKTAGLEVTDRIKLYVTAPQGLREALDTYRDYVAVETLAVELSYDRLPPEATLVVDDLDGEQVSIGLVKA